MRKLVIILIVIFAAVTFFSTINTTTMMPEEPQTAVISVPWRGMVDVGPALKRIDSKEHLLPWQGRSKKLFVAGVSFNRKRVTGAWKFDEQ